MQIKQITKINGLLDDVETILQPLSSNYKASEIEPFFTDDVSLLKELDSFLSGLGEVFFSF